MVKPYSPRQLKRAREAELNDGLLNEVNSLLSEPWNLNDLNIGREIKDVSSVIKRHYAPNVNWPGVMRELEAAYSVEWEVVSSHGKRLLFKPKYLPEGFNA